MDKFICLIIFCLLNMATAQSPASSPTKSLPAITKPPVSSPTQLPAASPSPTNVTKVLEKPGHFNIFIRLLRATQEDNHLLTLLNNSNNGATIFAPTDSAFSSLKSGTLNALSDDAKSELVKFHVIPTFISSSQFQTVSNPIATEAGSGGRVSLNVTSYGDSVNISTGLTNTSISGNVYSDDQLAVYKLDKVLLPFAAKPIAPAPAPAALEKPNKKKSPPVVEQQGSSPIVQVDTSGSCTIWAEKVNAACSTIGIAIATAFLI
uniref:Putative fasciclin-like AGP n=1 Tax=Linum usitatissimum TaxID=4006 RepID=G8GJ84_LINUS|nr:putative fasciclin-like AGP [Linum usitatissimum]